jgi:superfamily II DNA helicase RecQ
VKQARLRAQPQHRLFLTSAMPYEFIQIPANGQGNAKDALNQLLQGGRIASVRKEFVANGEDSFWAFCVEYLEPATGGPKGRTGTAPKVDYKERLSAEDFAVFAKLRELRKELAEKEAVPAYAIFTNEQLAAMVTGKVSSLSDLGKIDGVGDARQDKYGRAFLDLLAGKGAAQ